MSVALSVDKVYEHKTTRDEPEAAVLPRSSRKVPIVSFIFETVVLEDVGVRQQLFDDAERNRAGESLRIGDGEAEIQMAKVATVEALLDAHVLAVSGAARIQPTEIVEAGGIDHKGVALPPAD